MNKTSQHALRIQNELQKAGIGGTGKIKFIANYLAGTLLPNEHVIAAISGGGNPVFQWLPFGISMIVATSDRIIFIKRDLSTLTTDEFSYEVVSGIKLAKSGMFTDVTLHAAVGNIEINDVSSESANKFVRFIEQKRLKKPPE